jgi:hypothetical protein
LISDESMPTTLNCHYSPLRETERLLAAGQVLAQTRLNADDMLTAEDAANLKGANPELLIREAAAGRLIGVRSDDKGMVFPAWQFRPGLKAAIRAISQELHSTDGWTLLRFFESPQVALDELSPRQAIERGLPLERIVDLARAWEFS